MSEFLRLNGIDDEAPHSSLVLAFSGGLDSTVLLHRFARDPAWRARLRLVLHIDHGLQLDSAKWAAHCEAMAHGLNLPFESIRVSVETEPGEGLEAAARRARYAALESRMQANEVLVTAHHRDDQIETLMLKLLRGGGAGALAGMKTLRRFGPGWLWRPLLETPRAQLLAYATRNQLQWIDDPSNASDRHDRNFIRHEILPRLRERFAGTDVALAHSGRLLAHTHTQVRAQAARALAQARTLDPRALRIDALEIQDDFMLGEVIRLWCESLGINKPGHPVLQRIRAELMQARDDAEPVLTWGETHLRRHRNLLYLVPVLSRPSVAWTGELQLGKNLELPAGLGHWAWAPHPSPDTHIDQHLRDHDSRLDVWTTRFRQDGETLRLAANRPRLSLKQFLQDAGIPPWQRERIPLLFQDDQLLAVGDLHLDHELRAAFAARGLVLQWQR